MVQYSFMNEVVVGSSPVTVKKYHLETCLCHIGAATKLKLQKTNVKSESK